MGEKMGCGLTALLVEPYVKLVPTSMGLWKVQYKKGFPPAAPAPAPVKKDSTKKKKVKKRRVVKKRPAATSSAPTPDASAEVPSSAAPLTTPETAPAAPPE